MFENLAAFQKRFEELGVRLCDPTVTADQKLYTDLMKEYSTLEPLVAAYRRYEKAQADRSEAQELLADSSITESKSATPKIAVIIG